jgi:hypothetical protein
MDYRGIISNHDAMAQSIMGERQVQQDALFYEFSLERHVGVAAILPGKSIVRVLIACALLVIQTPGF